MRIRLWSVLLWVAASLGAQDRDLVRVQRKVALVIGNAAYPQSPLKNPVNDAVAMADVLRRLGFEVTEGRDLGRQQMEEAVDRFAGRVQAGDLALFYYAGHGAQLQQENYLIPVDFQATSPADVKYRAYPASLAREKLEERGARLRILILDACRNNPFRATRSGADGLAAMKSDAEGTLIAFATGDNNVAADNPAENNGLFTKHLVAALQTPALSLDEIFRRVKQDVYLASGRKQNPFTYDNIVGRYYFQPGPAVTAAPPASPDLDRQTELAYWTSIKDENNAELIEEYMQRYPAGQFVTIARARLVRLRTLAAATPPPPVGKQPFAPVIGYGTNASPPPRVPETGVSEPRVNPKDGQRYVWIPPGSFQMGCSPGDSECDADEKPAHPVTISRGFWLGQTEVTVAAYRRFTQATGRNLPSGVLVTGIGEGGVNIEFNPQMPTGPSGERLPVNVGLDDARAYCGWMGGRLPTEAEWEYAARGGSTEARHGSLDSIAWYSGNSGNAAHPVGEKQPNKFGLYDMLGNVWEWVADWYDKDYYAQNSSGDPQGPETGSARVVRGGSWYYRPGSARVSRRYELEPGRRYKFVGFRCAWEVP